MREGALDANITLKETAASNDKVFVETDGSKLDESDHLAAKLREHLRLAGITRPQPPASKAAAAEKTSKPNSNGATGREGTTRPNAQ